MPHDRVLIGHLKAVVEFPLYEGDSLTGESWNDFIYEQPGVTPKGELGVCRRDCKTLSFEIVHTTTPTEKGQR